MSKKGQPWDNIEEQGMLEELRSGMTLESVARRHERTTKAILWKLATVFQKILRSKSSSTSLEQLCVEYHRDEEEMREILTQLSEQNPKPDKPPTTMMDTTMLEEINNRTLKILKAVKKIQEEVQDLKQQKKTMKKSSVI